MKDRRWRTRTRGFSLPELMTVVALLAVVAVLGSLSLSRRRRAEAALGLARELYAQAAAARALAISSSCQVLLLLDPQDADGDGFVTQLRIAAAPGANAGGATSEVLSRVARQREVLLTGAVGQVDLAGPPPPPSGGAEVVLFAPDGTARLGSAAAGQLGATLYTADMQGGAKARVVIFGGTGLSRVVAR